MNQCEKINTSEIHHQYLSDIVTKQARMNAFYNNIAFKLLVTHHQMVDFNEININWDLVQFKCLDLLSYLYINTITALREWIGSHRGFCILSNKLTSSF